MTCKLSPHANEIGNIVLLNQLAYEMEKYLPVLQAAESDSEIWNKITEGTGVATLNGYKNVLNKLK